MGANEVNGVNGASGAKGVNGVNGTSGVRSAFDIWTLESRFGSSQWWDFRIRYQKRDDTQVMASLRLYL